MSSTPLWASLRTSSPPRNVSSRMNPVSPSHALLSGIRNVYDIAPSRATSSLADSPIRSPADTAESELKRLLSLSDIGSSMAESVVLRGRLREVEQAHSQCALEMAHMDRAVRERGEELETARSENVNLMNSLRLSHSATEKSMGEAAVLRKDVERERDRADDALRRVYQLQALMVSQTTAASGVFKDWMASGTLASGLDHARGQSLAFFRDQLALAQERAEEATLQAGMADARASERLVNETLALRLQLEACQTTAAAQVSSMSSRLGKVQEWGEEREERLGKCEEALRAALERLKEITSQREEAFMRITELERQINGLRVQLEASNKSMEEEGRREADLKSKHAEEMAQLSLAHEAQLKELQSKFSVSLASRTEPAKNAAPVSQQAVVTAPPTSSVPDEHDTEDNPLLPRILPRGAYITSMNAFIDYVRGSSIGLKSSQLLIFVDCTKSNEMCKTFKSKSTGLPRSLHDTLDPGDPNPYQITIKILGKRLEQFDDDKLVPLYGFGDRITKEKYVFPYDQYDKARELEKTPEKVKDLICNPSCGVDAVLDLYLSVHGRTCDCKAGPFSKEEIVHVESCTRIKLQGGTSFAPAIRKAVELVKEKREFTLCLIIADGCVSPNCLLDSEQAVLEASEYPISIVTIGVGDGEPHNPKEPNKGQWHQMEEFDERLGDRRKFDNFHFVEFNYVKIASEKHGIPFEEMFALMALSELPAQYLECKKLGLI